MTTLYQYLAALTGWLMLINNQLLVLYTSVVVLNFLLDKTFSKSIILLHFKPVW